MFVIISLGVLVIIASIIFSFFASQLLFERKKIYSILFSIVLFPIIAFLLSTFVFMSFINQFYIFYLFCFAMAFYLVGKENKKLKILKREINKLDFSFTEKEPISYTIEYIFKHKQSKNINDILVVQLEKKFKERYKNEITDSEKFKFAEKFLELKINSTDEETSFKLSTDSITNESTNRLFIDFILSNDELLGNEEVMQFKNENYITENLKVVINSFLKSHKIQYKILDEIKKIQDQ